MFHGIYLFLKCFIVLNVQIFNPLGGIFLIYCISYVILNRIVFLMFSVWGIQYQNT